MSCCKKSYIMRLFDSLGNRKSFPLPLLSMTFIFVIIPFYLPLAHLFLFMIADCILLESKLLYEFFFFSVLSLLLCNIPNFTPSISYLDILSTKGLHQHYEKHIRLEAETLPIFSDVLFTLTL